MLTYSVETLVDTYKTKQLLEAAKMNTFRNRLGKTRLDSNVESSQ
jgi:hypothetical protein